MNSLKISIYTAIVSAILMLSITFIIPAHANAAIPTTAAAASSFMTNQSLGCVEGNVTLVPLDDKPKPLAGVTVFAIRLGNASTYTANASGQFTSMTAAYYQPNNTIAYAEGPETENFTTVTGNDGSFSFCMPRVPAGWYIFQARYNGTLYDSGVRMQVDKYFGGTANIYIEPRGMPVPVFSTTAVVTFAFIALLLLFIPMQGKKQNSDASNASNQY